MQSSQSKMYATKKLMKEFKVLNESHDLPFSLGLEDENDMFKWLITIYGPEESIYEGGLFQATMEFPPTYPNNPPKLRFTTAMWHPNIYKNGEVCVSILHEPVFDETNEMETMEEKWRPILGVKEVLLSVISMLCSPNLESNANVDASIQYRNDKAGFNKKVRDMIDNQ